MSKASRATTPVQPGSLVSQIAVFEKMLNRKSSALWVAIIAFGAGIVALGAVLVLVLWSIA